MTCDANRQARQAIFGPGLSTASSPIEHVSTKMESGRKHGTLLVSVYSIEYTGRVNKQHYTNEQKPKVKPQKYKVRRETGARHVQCIFTRQSDIFAVW